MIHQKEKIKSYFPVEVKTSLTDWERKFISSLYNSKKEWSPKQQEVLQKLIDKYNLVQQVVTHTITYIPYDDSVERSYNQKITTRQFRKIRAIKKNKKGTGRL